MYWCLSFLLSTGLFLALPVIFSQNLILVLLILWLAASAKASQPGSGWKTALLHGGLSAFVYMSLYFTFYYQNWRPPTADTYLVTGQIVEPVFPAKFKGTAKSTKLMFQLIEVNGQKVARPFGQPAAYVRLSWYPKEEVSKNEPEFKQGDRLRFKAKLSPISGFENQAGFSYSQWLFAKQITGTGYIKSEIEILGRDPHSSQRALDRLAMATKGVENQGIFLALTLGLRDGIPEGQGRQFRELGIGHLLAISGLHIGIIYLVLYVLSKWALSLFRVNRLHASAMLLSLVCLWAYLFLIGFVISALRAGLLVTLWVALNLSFRYLSKFKLLLFVATLSVLVSPTSLLQPAWYLSFTAVLAIFIFLESRAPNYKKEEQPIKDTELKPAQEARRRRFNFYLLRPSAKLLKGLMHLAKLQVWLLVFLLPVTLYWFGGVSLAGLVANLVAVPLFSLVIVPANFVLSLMALGGMPWVAPLYSVLDALLNGLWQVFDVGFNWLPKELVFLYAPSTLFVYLAFVVLVVLAIRTQSCFNKAHWGFGGMTLLPILGSLAMSRFSEFAPSQFRLLDVGQGTSVLLTQGQQAWLYDLGPVYPSGFNATDAVVVPSLRRLGISSVEQMIISHDDKDHIGVPESLTDNLTVKKRLVGCRKLEILSEYQASQQTWLNFDWQLIWPVGSLELEKYQALSNNDSSCVIRLVHRPSGLRILLTGDITEKVERKLLQLAQGGKISLNADILLSAHHGSKYSSSAAFLFKVMPKLVLHSSGVNNRFDFPTAVVKERVANVGAVQLSTREVGEIVIELPIQRQKTERFHVETALNQWTPFWKRRDPCNLSKPIR